MAIEINKSTKRVEKPTVKITGREIYGSHSIGGTDTFTMINKIEPDSTVSTNWRNQEVSVFSGNVTVTITPDPKFAATNYNDRSSGDFVGEVPVKNGIYGNFSETYYTLNGKNPKRTKSNLYIGPFTLRRNESGFDNTILKTRTYYNGQWSEVTTVEFRIVRTDDRKV